MSADGNTPSARWRHHAHRAGAIHPERLRTRLIGAPRGLLVPPRGPVVSPRGLLVPPRGPVVSPWWFCGPTACCRGPAVVILWSHGPAVVVLWSRHVVPWSCRGGPTSLAVSFPQMEDWFSQLTGQGIRE